MSQQEGATTSDGSSSEVEDIRRDIVRTQSELGGTIDAIQERLSPSSLMAEARGPVEDTTDHIVTEVQRAVQESVDHLITQAREPVEEVIDRATGAVEEATERLVVRATAAVEEASERLVTRATAAAQEATDHILERARVTVTETASNIVEQTGQAVRAATIGKVEKMASKVGGTTRDMADNANETTKGLGSTVMQTIGSNPLPAALAAIGLSWLYLKRPKSASSSSSASYNTTPTYYRNNAGIQTPATGTAGTAGQGVGGAVSAVGDAVSGAVGTVAGAVSGTAGTVGDVAGGAASIVGDTVAGTASTVGTVVGGAASAVGGTVGQVADGTQDVARNLLTEIQYQALRVEEGFKTLAQQNPLALGAAGIALGSLIGLAVPESQVEHHLMGGARDAVLDQAGETAQDALSKVGHVASEASKTVKQEAVAGGLVS